MEMGEERRVVQKTLKEIKISKAGGTVSWLRNEST